MRFHAAPLLALALGMSACTSWRAQTAPAPEVVSAHGDGAVRLVRHDGSVVVLRHPQVAGDSIAGEMGDPPRRVAVATAEVQRVDVRRVNAARTGGLTLGLLVVVAVVATAAAFAALMSDWN